MRKRIVTQSVCRSVHGALLLIVGACAEPSGPPPPALAVSGVVERATSGVSQLSFTARNEGSAVILLSGCPRAPGFSVESELGAWFEVASVGVVCLANQVAEQVAIAPGQSVTRSFGVATPGTYRFRLVVNDPRGGTPLTFTSNSLVVP